MSHSRLPRGKTAGGGQRKTKALKRINQLFDATLREPFTGIGKPEGFRENLSGFWSRRIDETNRLVFVAEEERVVVITCR
jgi:toxin YoeB